MELMPQEVEVWYLIPAIRRELTKIFILDFKLNQKQISEILGVTESAISQYQNSKRAQDLKFSKKEIEKIRKFAKKIILDKKKSKEYFFKLCLNLRGTKSLCSLHKKQDKNISKKISKDKNEPRWMLEKRLLGLKIFQEKPMPNWGPDISKLDLSKIIYYMKPNAKKNSKSWDDVPKDIRNTYERLGIPKAEQESLGGVGAQYESEVVYHNLKKDLEKKGIIFLDMDEAVKKYPELVKKYFMTNCVPINLHKFSALHAAVWSGGTFIYVPKKVKVNIPLQAYFRMNAKKGGQFEHTLIIVDEGAEMHYIEGCSAPQYSENSLHAGCVEIYVLKVFKIFVIRNY